MNLCNKIYNVCFENTSFLKRSNSIECVIDVRQTSKKKKKIVKEINFFNNGVEQRGILIGLP